MEKAAATRSKNSHCTSCPSFSSSVSPRSILGLELHSAVINTTLLLWNDSQTTKTSPVSNWPVMHRSLRPLIVMKNLTHLKKNPVTVCPNSFFYYCAPPCLKYSTYSHSYLDIRVLTFHLLLFPHSVQMQMHAELTLLLRTSVAGQTMLATVCG